MGIQRWGNRAGQVGVYEREFISFGFPLKFICNGNEMVKHESVQLVAVMHLLAGLPAANKHQEEEDNGS